MPTNRQRRTRVIEAPVSENVRHFLETGEPQMLDLKVFLLRGDRNALRVVWEKIRAEILAIWLREHPCSRPWAWWELDAPRWTRKFDAWFDGTLPEPRRRLGGVGTPNFEVLAYTPLFSFGLPTGFGGDFAGKAIDATDLPRYESQAQYLLRLNLLTEAEKRHLAKHPELLEPERVLLDEGERTEADE